MTFTYLVDYVKARINKRSHILRSKRMIQAVFMGRKLKLIQTMTTTTHELVGPVLALDLGMKLVGAAVSDERLVTTKRLEPLKRSNWKKLLQDVRDLLERFDAQTIVVGLPLRMDGTDGDAAQDVRRIA